MKLVLSGFAGYPELFPKFAGPAWLGRSGRFVVPFVQADEAAMLRLLRQGGDRLLGWSSGAHCILKHPETWPLWERIVLAAPFLALGKLWPRRVFKQMIAGLESDPKKLLADFYANCGLSEAVLFREADLYGLSQNLVWLADSRTTIPDPAPPHGNLTLVFGTSDRIVPLVGREETVAQLPEAKTLLVASGHSIPETALIQAFDAA